MCEYFAWGKTVHKVDGWVTNEAGIIIMVEIYGFQLPLHEFIYFRVYLN